MLSAVDGRFQWPQRGCYFFFERGECRRESGSSLRVTRIGTHAVSSGSKTTLWNRLSQHRGIKKTGGGNHRGSVFRKIVGKSMTVRDDLFVPSWGIGNSAKREVRLNEEELEIQVSEYVGSMPFLWLEISDQPSATSIRSYIERNCIALLSNFRESRINMIDTASDGWLGSYCPAEKVRQSGLWNSNYVDSCYDPEFIGVLKKLVSRINTS